MMMISVMCEVWEHRQLTPITQKRKKNGGFQSRLGKQVKGSRDEVLRRYLVSLSEQRGGGEREFPLEGDLKGLLYKGLQWRGWQMVQVSSYYVAPPGQVEIQHILRRRKPWISFVHHDKFSIEQMRISILSHNFQLNINLLFELLKSPHLPLKMHQFAFIQILSI